MVLFKFILIAFVFHSSASFSVGADEPELVKAIETYPYMATLVHSRPGSDKVIVQCSATIVHKHYVLTPSHCVTQCGCETGRCLCKDYPYEQLFVYVGTLESNGGSQITVEECFFHPKFKLKYFSQKCKNEFDIAVVALNRDLTFNAQIGIVPLTGFATVKNISLSSTSKYVNESKVCTLVGWFDAGDKKNYLKTVQVQISTADKCNNKDPSIAMCEARQICSFPPSGGANACGSDVGAALICEGEQVAIATRMHSCNDKDLPTVYVRTDLNWRWIQDVLQSIYFNPSDDSDSTEDNQVRIGAGDCLDCSRFLYLFCFIINLTYL